jgi:hypothetical protein
MVLFNKTGAYSPLFVHAYFDRFVLCSDFEAHNSDVCFTLSISTNWSSSGGDAGERIAEMLLSISAKVAAIAQLDEKELLLEFRPSSHLVFGRSTALCAHCYWAVSSPLDKWQNSELHKVEGKKKYFFFSLICL